MPLFGCDAFGNGGTRSAKRHPGKKVRLPTGARQGSLDDKWQQFERCKWGTQLERRYLNRRGGLLPGDRKGTVTRGRAKKEARRLPTMDEGSRTSNGQMTYRTDDGAIHLLRKCSIIASGRRKWVKERRDN
uniref:Uncharacterized protein n=1 Tax=Trichuris muris TaxID=70415 RepID=A0A5S6QYH6_TRIMR